MAEDERHKFFNTAAIIGKNFYWALQLMYSASVASCQLSQLGRESLGWVFLKPILPVLDKKCANHLSRSVKIFSRRSNSLFDSLDGFSHVLMVLLFLRRARKDSFVLVYAPI